MKVNLSEFIYSGEPLEGTIDASSGPGRIPEQRLWQAALVQLLIDATQKDDNPDKRSAIAFFEASIYDTQEGTPTTATWRDDMCYLSGFHPEFIHAVYRRLRQSDISLGKYRIDEILRALEDEENT